MTLSPTDVARFPGLSAEASEFWSQTGRDLAKTMTVPDRSTDAPLVEWIGPVRATSGDEHVRPGPMGAGLVAAGVALGDVVAFSLVSPVLSKFAADHAFLAYNRLIGTLSGLARERLLPSLGVRDTIGWALVHEQATSSEPWAGIFYTARRAYDWAGIGPDGWLYCAAGFTPAETSAMKSAGTLDPAQARMMAALRGMILPVG